MTSGDYSARINFMFGGLNLRRSTTIPCAPHVPTYIAEYAQRQVFSASHTLTQAEFEPTNTENPVSKCQICYPLDVFKKEMKRFFQLGSLDP